MNNLLVNRLASLPNFSDIPKSELQWLTEHGHYKVFDKGSILAPKGKPVYNLYIVLSGNISIRVDHGIGAKQVGEWLAGDVTGMLPYSRMTGPPGDNCAKENVELLSVSVKLFPEMINQCPSFTAYTVHSMLDRARNFNTNALQDEKMTSLGKLAAGLAHEINNPASAAVRDAKLIIKELLNLDESSHALGSAALKEKQFNIIKKLCAKCLEWSEKFFLSPIQKADYQDEINNWLLQHHLDPALALQLADTSVTIKELNILVSSIPDRTIDVVLRWIMASYTVHSLALDMEHSVTQIYKLVDSFKKFTYMDNLADKEAVDIEPGIRDTINVLVAKVKSSNAAINLEIDANLPRVHAKGSELNQVWLSLIDNALDAIPNSGNIHITACSQLNRVEVRIIDNGPGIPEDKISSVFDAFFTTKSQGHGIGLGLDLARRILHRYHGEIYVQSRPGHTEFIVSLATEE
jgi:signal transduction histidine kinase